MAEVRETVSRWREIFREAEVSNRDMLMLSACFSAADEAEKMAAAVRNR